MTYHRQNKVISRIKNITGLNANQFCDKYLSIPASTFYHQIRENALRLSEIKIIIAVTGTTFEELFLGREPMIIVDQEEPGEKPEPKIIAKPKSTNHRRKKKYRDQKLKEERDQAEREAQQAQQLEKDQKAHKIQQIKQGKSFLDLIK